MLGWAVSSSSCLFISRLWGTVAQWLDRATDNREVAGLNSIGAAWKLWQLPLPHFAKVPFGRDTKKSLLYLVFMPGE